MKRQSTGLLSIVVFGYAFLYIPLLSVIIYSFNDSRLVSVWGGFSLRWYHELLQSEEIWAAAMLSLRIAAISATMLAAPNIFLTFILLTFMAVRNEYSRGYSRNMKPVSSLQSGDTFRAMLKCG